MFLYELSILHFFLQILKSVYTLERWVCVYTLERWVCVYCKKFCIFYVAYSLSAEDFFFNEFDFI